MKLDTRYNAAVRVAMGIMDGNDYLSYEPDEVLPFKAGEDEPQEIEMLLQDFSKSLFPSDNSVQIKDVDNLLAQELTQLSVAEREDVLCDVHAVVKSGILQTPPLETRTKALQQVRRIIQNDIPDIDKEAYEQAMKLDSSYAGADDFLLRFIRAANWDARTAAQRIVAHFKIKLELFPSHLLCLDIAQDDMDPTTLDLLYSGYSQDLPLRDMAGRLVTIFMTANPSADNHEHKLRRMFYSAMVQTEDLETQVKGRVIIVWLQDRSHGLDYGFSLKIRNLVKGLPIKNVAIHVCMPGNENPGFAQVTGLAALAFAMERILLVRMKFHFGATTELKQKLQDFGIPSSILPISETGEVSFEHVNQRWTKRREEERVHRQTKARRAIRAPGFPFPATLPQQSSETTLASIENPAGVESSDLGVMHLVNTPSNTDVLLGRGIHTQKHCGNILFRDLIAKRLDVYDSLPNKSAKVSMSAEIVQQVKGEFGGRFLEGKGSGWVEVADVVARDKVATAFRTIRRSRRKN